MTDFSSDNFTSIERSIITLLEHLSAKCHKNSKEKGFWADQDVLLTVVDGAEYILKDRREGLRKALDDAFYAMKCDLMHSELGERTEAQRKDLSSDKLDGYTGEEEELADLLIRVFDYAGRRKLRLGEAVVLKMQYNTGREYMHGKGF